MKAQKDGAGRLAGLASLARWIPLAGLAAALAALYAFGLHDLFSLEALRRHHANLSAQVAENLSTAVAVYVVTYVAVVAISFPGAGFLTIAGGFLFGWVLGGALAVLSATAGAILIFLIARTSVGDILSRRAGPRLLSLRRGFQENSFNYLLFLRLAPVFPFFLVNLAAAVFGIRLLPYVGATALGILPATYILAYFGAGLRTALGRSGSPFSAELLLGLALLAALALLPVVIQKWRRGKSDAHPQPLQFPE